MRQIIKEATKPCLFCGSEENIVFHHYWPYNKKIVLSGADTYQELLDEIPKCWCLCNECHNKLHLGVVIPLPECY